MKENTIHIKSDHANTSIDWSYTVYFKKTESGRYYCFIPSFGIRFAAIKEDEIGHKSSVVTRMFFDYFLKNKQLGLGKLGIELHKRGFTAPHDTEVMRRMNQNERVNAKFDSPVRQVPSQFDDAEKMSRTEELTLA